MSVNDCDPYHSHVMGTEPSQGYSLCTFRALTWQGGAEGFAIR